MLIWEKLKDLLRTHDSKKVGVHVREGCEALGDFLILFYQCSATIDVLFSEFSSIFGFPTPPRALCPLTFDEVFAIFGLAVIMGERSLKVLWLQGTWHLNHLFSASSAVGYMRLTSPTSRLRYGNKRLGVWYKSP